MGGQDGYDTMIGGGGGLNIYVVDNIGDVVIENGGYYPATVQSSITYTLGANVKDLTLTGTAAINGVNGLFKMSQFRS